MDQTSSWEGESAFCEPYLVPKTSTADGSRGRWESQSQERAAGSGLLSRKAAGVLDGLDQDNRGFVLLNLSALPENFLPCLRGSKPTCPECRGLPG